MFLQLGALFVFFEAGRPGFARTVTPAERQGEAGRRADRRGYKRTQRLKRRAFILVCAPSLLQKVVFLDLPSVEGGLDKEQRRLLGPLL